MKNIKKYFYILYLLCLGGIVGLFFSSSAVADMPQPLSADKAFQFSVRNIQSDAIHLHWEIAKGYHLYRDRFQFSLLENKNNTPPDIQLGQIVLPPGIPTHDDILGDYQIYKNNLDIAVPLIITAKNKHNIILLVTYQGCESTFCYPAITKKVTFNIQDLTKLAVENHRVDATASYSTLQEKVTRLLEGGNYFWICIAFVGLGLLLAFTPCVLPMIPILSGIIVGQDRKNLTTYRAFMLSLAYVLGMSAAYAIAGVLVALLGSHLSETFQTPWVIIVFSVLFILLAFSLFGFYELKLPHFIHHRILHLSNKQKSGSYIGALIMGALSVLIVSPCVTAPLVGILTFIAQKGNVILGSLALFALGLGMGLPLLIIGATEGKFLPKSGYWMNTVKSAFGVLLLGVAIYLLQRILPGGMSLILWAGLCIIVAVYLWLGTDSQRYLASGWVKFSKGVGVLLFCYGVILLVGGALGNSDPLYPLRITQGKSMINSDSTALSAESFSTFSEVESALNKARVQHQPVMLDFYADWCVACHEMDKTTFSNPQVKSALQHAVLVRVNITRDNAESRKLQSYFNVIAPPTILFFDENGKELSQFRVIGAMSSQDFLQHLQYIGF